MSARPKSPLPKMWWVALFAALTLTAVAVPVLAAEPPVPATEAVQLPPQSLEARGDWVPDGETVREGLIEAEQQEAKRERELESPEAAQERAASREAFVQIDAKGAEALLREKFATQLQKLNLDPARYLSQADVVRPLGGGAATVIDEGDHALLDAEIPLKAMDESGDMRPVDVSLESTAEGFETENAETEITIGDSAGDPIAVGDEGMSIAPAGLRTSSSTRRYGEQNVFQFETLTDTDTLISPITSGVEIFHMLRSERSPENFDFEIEVPAGAELRDYGGSGAAILKEGKPIAVVPPPTAVDAQGSEVPVNLVVEGGSLRLETGHRRHDYAYPILLDPILQAYNWYGTGENKGLEDGAWTWASNPYGLIYFGTGNPCYYFCWGRGLYLTAPARNYGAQTYSHWAYSAPNAHSYVENVQLNPFWRHEHGCASPTYNEPHDYVGYVDNNSNWIGTPVNNATKAGAVLVWASGRAFVVGASSGPGINIPCWRDFYAGVAGVWLDDWHPPSISSPWGMPTGWIDAGTPHSVNVNVVDSGLGVHRVKLLPEGKPIAYEDHVGGCTGLYANRCPTTNYTSHLTLKGGSVGEGVRSVSVSALDPTGKATATAPFQVKVDYSKPAVTLDGQLAVATKADEGEAKGDQAVEELNLPVYNLQIKATDEGAETNSEHRKRSGVKDIEIWLEEEGQPIQQMPVPWEPTPSCVASCSKEGTYVLELGKLAAAGTHRVEVRVIDFAGNEKTRDIEFEYFPATGMKDEYVMHYFPLPDGQGNEDEEAHPRRPELAVNVMNGNLVYRQVDVDLESSAQADLEVERYYNSQLPDSESSEWGEGWTLAGTPDLDPEVANAPLAAAATMTQDPSLTERYFSLWLDMPSPEGTKAGYELRFKLVGTDTYDVTLSKWQGGSETGLASKSGVAFTDGDSLAIVDEGSTVSAWTDGGAGFAQLLSAVDSTFEQGRAGLHGAGNIVRIADFKAGSLGAAPSTIPAELAALPVTEPFDGSAASLERFQSEWSALSWAGGSSSAKGGNTTSGWRPLSAYATVNGAFHHQHLDGSAEIPEEAELRDSSGVVESDVALPTESGQEEFDPELQVSMEKRPGGGYLMTDETGESATAVAFDGTGQAEALVTEGEAKVDYSYESGELTEIAVEDPATLVTDEPTAVETSEPQPTEGTPLFHSAFGALGAGEAQFNTPTDVALGADGDLWVADSANHRIQHFNPAGEFIDQFGTQGAGEGQLQNPASIAIDAEGDIWVADKNNYRIQKFSPSGDYLDHFGSQGSGEGQLNRPEGIAIDAAGDIWVSDTYNYRVQKFGSDGEFIEVVAPEGLGVIEPTGIDAGPEGRIWVADWSNNRVVALSEEGGFELAFGSAGSGPGQFNRPDAIEADEHGNVWVGDQNNGRIQRFDQEGAYVDEFGSKGSGAGQFSFSYPFGFAVGEDRRLWIADRNNHRVQRWDPPYEVSEEPLPEDDDPSVEIAHDGGLVQTLSGDEAGEIAYEHEGELLTAVDGPEGETLYDYDGADRLVKVTLPNDTYGEIAYHDDGRVKSVTVNPAGEEPAETTSFAYTDAPNRRTEVEVPGAPNLTYDIGEDGSVLKWWNTAGPPDLTLSGTLYVNREIEDGISPGDHELQAWAEEEEGVKSLQIIVGGDVLVEELACEQVGGPPPECTKLEPLAWVMETEASSPGHLQVEVIATDTDGESTAERFWVDIPEPAPLSAPGAPSPPRFNEIKDFRDEYGLEIVFPVASQIERNERIFNLIKAWHEPNTPAGQVARASWERWGVPLRPEDVAELEYREWLYDVNGEKIDQWVEATSPSSYGGYYMDHAAGGIMRIGFLGNQAEQLASLETSLPLVGGSSRLQPYPAAPTASYLSVRATAQSVLGAMESNSTLANLVTSVEDDEAGRATRIGTANVSQVESILDQMIGPNAPVSVEYEAGGGALLEGRYRNEGRMRAGDYINGNAYTLQGVFAGPNKCTAGFGAQDKKDKPGNGKDIVRLFVLTAGHCYAQIGTEVWRAPQDESQDYDDAGKSEVGRVSRNAIQYVEGNEVRTDGLAIRIKQEGIVPLAIWGWQGNPLPTESAGRARKGNTVCYSGAISKTVACGQIVARSLDWEDTGEPFDLAGYWVKFPESKRPQHGDSGAPIWNLRTGASIGLISAGRPHDTLDETLVAPLLHPPNMPPNQVPGILHHQGMKPLQLKLGG